MKDEYYKKVYIKSEADLPKKDGDYIVHSKTYKWIGLHNWKSFENESYPEYNQYSWLLNFDWYLQPIESSEPVPEDKCTKCVFDKCTKCVFKVNYDKFHSARVAFEKFRSQAKAIDLREELRKYAEWFCKGEIDAEGSVKEYLKQR